MTYAVGIDIGGTFTDTVIVREDGSISTYKSPTTPHALLDGFLSNLDLAAELEGQDLAGLLGEVRRIGHGTTVATNAMIERAGAKVALLTTRGFEDTIFAQRMMGMTAGLTRSEVTDYSRRTTPEPIVPPWLVFGVSERIDYKGEAVMPLSEDEVRQAARSMRDADVEAVAICFLWSFKNGDHESRAAEIIREELPSTFVSLSHQLVPRIGEYERTATTLINAYLGPRISEYLGGLEGGLSQRGSRARILLLDSSGQVMRPSDATEAPVRLLLSGPAGGLTASHFIGADLGHANVITFDMGGTSADVGLIVDGVALPRHQSVVEKYHLQVPMADITAIGAGGGSVARVEAGAYLQVGPDSAGADPGPVCYGRGGEHPTVTDADLVLGIIDPDRFLGGRLQLDADAAERAIHDRLARPLGITTLQAAAGVKRIVDARMADLLHNVTIQRGYDPRDFVLYAFGGAGPTHAPSFGLELVDEIVVPATQSVHSALGTVSSDLAFSLEVSEPMRISRDTAMDVEAIQRILEALQRRANRRLEQEGVPSENRHYERFIEVRFIRQTKELRMPIDPEGRRLSSLSQDFRQLYASLYGEESVPEAAGLELITFGLEARGALGKPRMKVYEQAGADPQDAHFASRDVYDPGHQRRLPAPIFDGEALRPGNVVHGPSVIEYPGTTVLLLSGQQARADRYLNLSIARTPQHD